MVTDRVRDIIIANPDAKITLICHSFGTWIVSRLFREQPSLKFHRLILCGAVVERDFPWNLYRDRLSAEHFPIVNECGHRDIWPSFAQVLSWQYGTSGVHGFFSPGVVRDRFHNTGHSDYFLGSFPEKFWKTLIWNDKLKISEFEEKGRKDHHPLRTLCEKLPLRWGVLASVLFLAVVVPLFCALYAWAPTPPFSKSRQLGMRFVPVRSSGKVFQMGAIKEEIDKIVPLKDAAEYVDELPQHPMQLDSFYIADTEVTCGQFFEVVGSRAHEFKKKIIERFSDTISFADERPVKGVTWLEAISFCNALSEREGIVPPFYTIREKFGLDNTLEIEVRDWNADGYRLPTETEWEFACRGGKSVPPEECDLSPEGEMRFGKLMLGVAWFGWNASEGGKNFDPDEGVKFEQKKFGPFYAPRVRSLKANDLGLYDMRGSVWEWCWDAYDENNYARTPAALKGPQPDKTNNFAEHILRGGGAWSSPRDIRSTCRFKAGDEVFADNERSKNYIFTGFRVARSMPWWAVKDRNFIAEVGFRLKRLISDRSDRQTKAE